MAEPDEIAERLADLTGRLESLLADLGRPVDEEGSTAELRLSSDTPVVEVLNRPGEDVPGPLSCGLVR